MIEYIYTITCKENGKVYVGRTCNHKRRKTQHLCKLSQQKHANKSLQASFNKYGVDALEFAVIESADSEVIKERELYYFNKLLGDGVTLFNHRIKDANGGVDFKSDITRTYIFDVLDYRYENRMSIKQAAKKFGTSSATIMFYAPEWEELRGKKMPESVQVEATIGRVQAFVDEFKRVGRATCRQFKLSHQSLVKYLPMFGMSFDDVRLDAKFITAKDRSDAAIRDVQSGMRIKDACLKHDVAVSTLYKYNSPAYA